MRQSSKTTDAGNTAPRPRVSMAIFAWNEERAIADTLNSLLRQSLFARLAAAEETVEVVCVLNGCTDGTAEVAQRAFETWRLAHPEISPACICRVASIPERGKLNAWNRFVHEISAPEARVLFMMDADILIHLPETLWSMLQTLERDPEAAVAVDRPCKDIQFKRRKSLRDLLSLASSDVTLSAEAQLCGQLYAIRATLARRMYLPRGLAACEDGFIKALVCTDLLEHEVQPSRLKIAPEAAHTFEAYRSPAAILRNQKRQIIGQTLVHILIDKSLAGLSPAQKRELGTVLRRRDAEDPGWLDRLVAEHLRSVRFCWRLHPGLLGQRFKVLKPMQGARRLLCLPSAGLASAAALVSSWLAWRTLRSGCTHYWPKARRSGLSQAHAQSQTSRLHAGVTQ